MYEKSEETMQFLRVFLAALFSIFFNLKEKFQGSLVLPRNKE